MQRIINYKRYSIQFNLFKTSLILTCTRDYVILYNRTVLNHGFLIYMSEYSTSICVNKSKVHDLVAVFVYPKVCPTYLNTNNR